MIWLVLYVGTILAANWSVANLGDCSNPGPCVVPVWFGVYAPSGVLWAGLAFTLRDLTQESLGKRWSVAAILVGAGLSWFVSPAPIALASGAAFLVSEALDFAVYQPLRSRNWLGAVALSNVVGFVADSALFLWLAFGSLAFIGGQLVGKLEMTALAVLVLWMWRARRAANVPQSV